MFYFITIIPLFLYQNKLDMFFLKKYSKILKIGYNYMSERYFQFYNKYQLYIQGLLIARRIRNSFIIII